MSIPELEQRLVAIKLHINALKQEKQRLETENKNLKSEVESLQKSIAFQKNIQNPEKLIKIAALLNQTEKKDLSRQIGAMIKKIDQSIAFIEQDLVETKNK